MWKPDESLDDYVVRPDPEVTPEPPPPVSLWRTGEVEVLKPLARMEVRTKSVRTAFLTFRPSGTHQPLWFRRFLVAGSGALVMIAFILVSAILVGINDSGADVAISEVPGDVLAQPEELFDLDVSYTSISPATEAFAAVRSSTMRSPTRRPRIRLVVHKPKRQLRPLPQPEEPKFFPTTLVIYAENGVIYSRIEPWLQAGYKKTPTFDN